MKQRPKKTQKLPIKIAKIIKKKGVSFLLSGCLGQKIRTKERLHKECPSGARYKRRRPPPIEMPLKRTPRWPYPDVMYQILRISIRASDRYIWDTIGLASFNADDGFYDEAENLPIVD